MQFIFKQHIYLFIVQFIFKLHIIIIKYNFFLLMVYKLNKYIHTYMSILFLSDNISNSENIIIIIIICWPYHENNYWHWLEF